MNAKKYIHTNISFIVVGDKRVFVLLLDLNSFTDDTWRSDMGRLFQGFGPSCENARSPRCVGKACDVGTWRFVDIWGIL